MSVSVCFTVAWWQSEVENALSHKLEVTNVVPLRSITLQHRVRENVFYSKHENYTVKCIDRAASQCHSVLISTVQSRILWMKMTTTDSRLHRYTLLPTCIETSRLPAGQRRRTVVWCKPHSAVSGDERFRVDDATKEESRRQPTANTVSWGLRRRRPAKTCQSHGARTLCLASGPTLSISGTRHGLRWCRRRFVAAREPQDNTATSARLSIDCSKARLPVPGCCDTVHDSILSLMFCRWHGFDV